MARSLLEPLARRRRIDAGEQRDDRDLRAAVRLGERALGLLLGDIGRQPHDPACPGGELLVRGADVDHQVAVGLAEPDHRDRRDRVQDELLRRAGLEPRRAGDELWPDDDRQLVVGAAGELGLLDRRQRDRQGSGFGGGLERGEHEGRPAARADADDGIRSGEGELRDRAAPGGGVVLGCLALGGRKPFAGDDRDDLAGRGGEGSFAFLGVELRDAAGRAGAHVGEPAAGLEPRNDPVDRRRELVRHRGHGARNRRVLVVHELHELRGRARVVVRVRTPRFRHEPVEAPGSLAQRHRAGV